MNEVAPSAAKPQRASFKTPNHPDWPVKRFSFNAWFIEEEDKVYNENLPIDQRFVPQEVWDTARTMQYLWNYCFRQYAQLRDIEPLKCKQGHDITHTQVYTHPKRTRLRFCAVCRDENEGKENFVYVNPCLRGAERAAHYEPVFDLIKSPQSAYKLFCAAEEQRIKAQAADDPKIDVEARIKALLLWPPSYEFVVTKFRDTFQKWMRNPQKFGPPRYKSELDRVRLTYKEKAGGKPAEVFVNSGGKWAGVLDTRHLAPAPNHQCPTCMIEGRRRKDGSTVFLNIQPKKLTAKCEYGHEHEKPEPPEKSREYMANGYFMLGRLNRGQRLNLHVSYNRMLPEIKGGLVKEVILSGKLVRPGGWQWNLIFSVQAPYPPLPRVSDGAVAIDFGWRRMPAIKKAGPDGTRVVVAPERIRVAMLYDGHGWHEVYMPLDLTRVRDAKAGRKISPQANWDLEEQLGARLQKCKEDLAMVDRSNWPEAGQQLWQGQVKMREKGLLNLRRVLANAGITVPALEDWRKEHAVLFSRSRHIETKLVDARSHAYRNLLDGIAKQSKVVIIDKLQVQDKAERPSNRKAKRKQKHAETGVWEVRTQEEIRREASAKWRDFVCLSDFKRFFLEACGKYGTVVVEVPQHKNNCHEPGCGLPIDFKDELHANCPEGHRQEKNQNAARDLWERITAESVARAAEQEGDALIEQTDAALNGPEIREENRHKLITKRDLQLEMIARRAAIQAQALLHKDNAPALSLDMITPQGRKLVRPLETPLAQAASAD